MKKIIWTGIAFLTIALHKANAQRLSTYNTIGWYTTTITPEINQKWSGHIEYQWRRTDWIQKWQQSLLRLGVSYQPDPKVQLHAGYGWIRTFTYGDLFVASVPRPFDEHRIYEQASIRNELGIMKSNTRFRLEQRWIARYENKDDRSTVGWTFLNRFRVMQRFDVPVSGTRFYGAAYDELMIGFGKNTGQNVFDQNRLSVLIGYHSGNKARLEAGFISQTLQFSRRIADKNVFQYNNGLIVNTYFNF